MDKLFGAICGAILGSVIDFWLSGILYERFPGPYLTDMPGWVFSSIITGFILGAISGVSLANRYPEDKYAIGKWCIIISLICGFLYLSLLRSETAQYGLKWALVDAGLSLIWCTFLLARGIWLVRKGLTWRKTSQHS